MPVLLTLTCGVLLLLTLVLVFNEFGEKSGCCGQYRFLSFFNLFLILPVVVWTAIVVFSMGIPHDDYTHSRYSRKLDCDRSFWKKFFWFVCLLCALEVVIIVVIFVRFCIETCRCLKYCCCYCCKNDKDAEAGEDKEEELKLLQKKEGENVETALLINS